MPKGTLRVRVKNKTTGHIEDFELREPHVDEGRKLYRLIAASPPLDCNSAYCYFLLARHFYETCIVALRESRVVGAVTGYIRPDDRETLFVWQVAVAEEARGRGLAERMLVELLERPVCAGVKYVETTVSPDNVPSNRTFERLAQRFKTTIKRTVFLERADFDADSQHDTEVLLRIGQLNRLNTTSVVE